MELTNNRSIDPPLMAGKPLVGSAFVAMAAQRFDWRLVPGEEVRVTYRPGVVHVVLKERNR